MTASTPHTIVRASAGSGKTYRLTNEFITRLFEGEDPSGMLATTFTRAAAGEILHRVLDRLSAAVVDDSALDQLRGAIKRDDLSRQECASVLGRLIGQLHRLSIMTIDSFFSRLAGSFSLELGLPVKYRMLEEDEDTELRARSVDRTIDECSVPEMVELLRSMQGQRVQMQTHSAIMKAVGSGYEMYLATDGDRDAWDTIRPVGEALSDADLELRMNQTLQASIPASGSGKPHGSWINARTRFIELAQDRSWSKLVDGGLGGLVNTGLVQGICPLYYKLDITEDLHEAIRPIIQHARHALSTEHINRTLAVWSLMERFDRVYRSAKMSGGQLSFDDPPRLLNESSITGDLDHLYFRLDARIRHVMLDEFQDTSMPQFMLLAPILDELLSQDEEERSVFVVGDVKQSLYTWRQAEPTLLGAMIERWETLHEESLAKSWRSSPIVLDAVNAVFGDLPRNEALDASAVGKAAAIQWNAQYEMHEAAKTELPGYVSLCVADGDSDEESPDAIEEVLWACANSVAEARTRSPDASIAVLVRQGKYIYPLLSKLSKLGIDACEDRGNPLVDSPSVAAAVSMLELIDHPSNSAALYHVRLTPLAQHLGLQNPGRIHGVASDLRQRIADQGCVPMLTEWLRACAPTMDARGHTRFTQLIELAGKLQDEGRSGAAVLAMAARSRKIDEPGHAPVRVITIHRSKGLEFDVVVLPLLGQAWSIKYDTMLSQRAHTLGPITRVSRYPAQALRAIHPDLSELYDHSMLRQINEELCCLYVAMTRARCSLQMIVPADKDGREGRPAKLTTLKPAHLLRAALAPGEPATPGAVLFESRSERDWAQGVVRDHGDRSDATPEPVTLRLQPPISTRAAQLRSVAPSTELAPEPFDAATLLRDQEHTRHARDHGHSVHAAFELLGWIDERTLTTTDLTEALTRLGHQPESITRAIEEFNASIVNPSIARVLTRSAWIEDHPSAVEARVFHERPFATRIASAGDERLVQGRIDRLVVGYDGDRAICAQIVDYKTDRETLGMDDAALKAHAQKHRHQMDAYRRAVAGMYGLDAQTVEVVLIFTGTPGVVLMSEDSAAVQG